MYNNLNKGFNHFGPYSKVNSEKVKFTCSLVQLWEEKDKIGSPWTGYYSRINPTVKKASLIGGNF